MSALVGCAALGDRVQPCIEITARIAAVDERHRLGHHDSAAALAAIVRRIEVTHLAEVELRKQATS